MHLKRALLAISFFIITTTVLAQNRLQTGMWRGVLKTSNGTELPFNFEVNDTGNAQQITVINGDERLKVTDVKVDGDSVFIRMPLFNSEFRLAKGKTALSGKWIKHLADMDAVMAFTASPNTPWRFLVAPKDPQNNITGKWSATFGVGKPGMENLVGVFEQKGTKVTGTFLSTTGDYRYLEGVLSGNKLLLSCFDGGHAFMFAADVNFKNILSNGKFYSGASGLDFWSAIKNDTAKLPDAYSLTSLKHGFKKLDFTFRDINGKNVSLSDSQFKNKVVIVQILGSWCPNCMDETNYFVSGYYNKYHDKGVEIIGLAYERSTDFAKSQITVQQLISHFKVPYPVLITGFTPGNGDPEKSLPALADFKGFPTTLIIDKNGDVRKIHTGFSGPGTGEYYTEFTNEFEKLTEDLLAGK